MIVVALELRNLEMAVITRFDADLSQSARRNDRSWLRPALTMACAIAMTVAVSGKVFAQDEDDDGDKTPEQTVIDTLMKGIGAKSMDNSGINYRERSPLVIPPSNALPAPEDRSKIANAPNWPKDPDVIRNKQAIADRKKNVARNSAADNDAFPISQTELNNGMSPRKTRQVDSDAPGNTAADGAFPLSPSELGYKGGLFSKLMPPKKEEQTFTGEPDRTSLVQPPIGYQTPSGTYAYGVDPDTKNIDRAPTEAEKRIYNGAPN